MYKDKAKQREAGKERTRRYRNKHKGVTNEGVTDKALPDGYIGAVPCAPPILEPNLKRGKDIKCFADLPPDVQQTIDRMSVVDGKIDQTIKVNRTAIAISYQHMFPDFPDRYHTTGVVCTGIVTGKPGDADYDGICTKEWRAERGR